MGPWCLSLSVVPWDFLLCRSQGALLTKHQDRGGIGARMEEILINSLCDQASSNEGKGGPFPLGITFLLATILLSSPTYHILNYDGGWRFLMAQISEESDLSKNLVFKRRVNHSKLSLSFIPFISVASPINLFSSLLHLSLRMSITFYMKMHPSSFLPS